MTTSRPRGWRPDRAPNRNPGRASDRGSDQVAERALRAPGTPDAPDDAVVRRPRCADGDPAASPVARSPLTALLTLPLTVLETAALTVLVAVALTALLTAVLTVSLTMLGLDDLEERSW